MVGPSLEPQFYNCATQDGPWLREEELRECRYIDFTPFSRGALMRGDGIWASGWLMACVFNVVAFGADILFFVLLTPLNLTPKQATKMLFFALSNKGYFKSFLRRSF